MKEVITKDRILKAFETKRYWLSVHTDENERKQVIASLEDLGLEDNGEHFVYKSEDLDDITDIARKSAEILKKSKYPGIKEDPSIFIYLTSQPQCPQCDFLGRFSDGYCSRCGAELTEKEYIEWEVE